MHPLRPLLPFLLVAFTAPSVLCQEAEAAAPEAPVAAAADPLGPDLAQRIAHEGIDESQVQRLLGDLTQKVGQRLTGSDNFTQACEWAAAEFRAMGLENVHLDPWGEWKLTWNRGAWVGRVTAPIELDMYVATEAWTAGTKGRQRAQVVLAPADGELESPELVAGKWVLSRRSERDPDLAPLPRRSVREACEAAGALGFVYRAGDPDEKYPTRVRVFGNHRTAMKPIEDAPTVPQIAVRADHFDELAALVEQGQDVVCEFEIGNTFRDEPIALHNVVAEIPGTEKPDEVVIVSAHLDSWHQAQGCTDNGTGTATTLEAARILAAVGARPKRTIRFCLWGGEEQGLLGSRAYVQKNRTAMPKVSALFNHDTGTNWAQGLAVTEPMRAQLAPIFAHVERLLTPPDADWDGDTFTLRVVERVSGGGGSDHASFLAAGVPGLDWNLKGRSDYFRHTWHTQWDTFDVAIGEYQRHTATVVAMAALGTANLDGLLDRQNVGGGGGRGQSEALAEAFFQAELDGLKFESVEADGRAAKMGVQKGDVLIEVGGEEVERTYQIFRLARDVEGDEVTLAFRRGETRFEVKVSKADLSPRRRAERPTRAPGDTVPTGPVLR